MLYTSRQVGGAVGIALLGAVFSSRFRGALPPEIRARAGGVNGGFQTIAPTVRRVVGEAFVSGLHAGDLLVSTLLAVTLLAAFRTRPATPTAEPQAALASSDGSG